MSDVHDILNSACAESSAFPASPEWLTSGGFIAILLALVAMFWGLAFICEEYCVPAITIFCKRNNISDDLAGGIFIGTGLSLPVLFVAFVGLFVSNSAIGVGAVVGGNAFNHLVTTACSIYVAPNQTMKLDPVIFTREMTFYFLSCLLLVWAIQDGNLRLAFTNILNRDEWLSCMSIPWSASLVLICAYVFYTLFDSNFYHIHNLINKYWKNNDDTTLNTDSLASQNSFSGSISGGVNTERTTVQNTAPAIFIQNLNLNDNNITSTTFADPSTFSRTLNNNNNTKNNKRSKHHNSVSKVENAVECSEIEEVLGDDDDDDMNFSGANPHHNVHYRKTTPTNNHQNLINNKNTKTNKIPNHHTNNNNHSQYHAHHDSDPELFITDDNNGSVVTNERLRVFSEGWKVRSEDERVGMALKARYEISNGHDNQLINPDSECVADNMFVIPQHNILKKCLFFLVFPMKYMIYLTVPDVRKPGCEHKALISIWSGIFWLALQSYVLTVGLTLIGNWWHISGSIMGLTVAAWAANYPAHWSSLVVAKDGYADVATCNVLGSNVFNNFIGLGLPWILYNLAYHEQRYDKLQDSGVVLSIVLLMVMIAVHYVVIAVCGWTLNTWQIPFLFLVYFAYIGYLCYFVTVL